MAQVGVSLVFTFMLLWDWPNISRGVTNLEHSRLSGIYNEVAPSMQVFAQLFGKALQAQTRIAFVNTVLTGAGMWLLGIPGLLLLSLFVFMCRYDHLRLPCFSPAQQHVGAFLHTALFSMQTVAQMCHAATGALFDTCECSAVSSQSLAASSAQFQLALWH